MKSRFYDIIGNHRGGVEATPEQIRPAYEIVKPNWIRIARCKFRELYPAQPASFIKHVWRGRLSEVHRSIGPRASMRSARCSGTRVSPGSAKTGQSASREGRRDPEDY